MPIQLLMKWDIVRTQLKNKTVNLRKNNKLHLHFILHFIFIESDLNGVKNSHLFEYLHLTYITMLKFYPETMAFRSFVHVCEMKEQLSWYLFVMLTLSY